MRTFAQGTSSGHHGGRVDSLPHPGFPRPVEIPINHVTAKKLCQQRRTGRKLEHQRYERSQLCLRHLLDWRRDAVND